MKISDTSLCHAYFQYSSYFELSFQFSSLAFPFPVHTETLIQQNLENLGPRRRASLRSSFQFMFALLHTNFCLLGKNCKILNSENADKVATCFTCKTGWCKLSQFGSQTEMDSPGLSINWIPFHVKRTGAVNHSDKTTLKVTCQYRRAWK